MNRNVRQGKLLTKLQEMSFFKKNILFIAICFVLLVFSTIGYAALNQKLFISGDLALRAVKDIRISDLKLVETLSGGYEQYNSKYTADTITITSALAEDGSATTYQATITNYGTTDMEIASISSNSTTWFADCTISGLAKGDEISAGASKTFKITLKRKANIATTDYVAATLIEFKFQEAKIRYLAYNIGGNSVQNGTPSPTSASEIESVGDRTENLIDEQVINRYSGYYLDGNGGPSDSNSRFIRLDPVTVKPDTTYTLSSNLGIYSVWFFNSGTQISKKYVDSDTSTFTTPTDCDMLRITLNNTSGNADVSSFEWIQLEEGSTASSYEPYGYKIPIKVSGKNLFDYDNTPVSFSSITKQDNGYKVSGNNIRFATYQALADHIGDTVTISFDLTTSEAGEFKIYQYHTNGIGIRFATVSKEMSANTTTKITLTGKVEELGTNENYSKGEIIIYKSGYTGTYFISNIQFELGSNMTDYVPYAEPKTYNIYLDEPLRKVGNYADSIDYASGKIIRNVKELVFTGNETWNMENLSYGNNFYTMLSDAMAGNSYKIYSNRFEYKTNGALSENYSCRISSSGNLNMRYSEITSATNFQEFLKTNSTTVVYALKTPIEETIELPEVTVSSLYTNYEILTDVEPSSFTSQVKVKN